MAQDFGLPGMLLDVGRAVSTDGGVLFVIRHLLGVLWQ
jgi:hypothetical protein